MGAALAIVVMGAAWGAPGDIPRPEVPACAALLGTFTTRDGQVSDYPVTAVRVGTQQVVVGLSSPIHPYRSAHRLARKVPTLSLRDAYTGESCGTASDARGVAEMPFRFRRFSEWIVWSWDDRADLPRLGSRVMRPGETAWVVWPEHPDRLLEVEITTDHGEYRTYVPRYDPVLSQVPTGMPVFDDEGQVVGLHENVNTATPSPLLRWSVADALVRIRALPKTSPLAEEPESHKVPGGRGDRAAVEDRLEAFLATEEGQARLAEHFPEQVAAREALTAPGVPISAFSVKADLPETDAQPSRVPLGEVGERMPLGTVCTVVAVVNRWGRARRAEVQGCDPGLASDLSRQVRQWRWRGAAITERSRSRVVVRRVK